jgi:hypothetical protein
MNVPVISNDVATTVWVAMDASGQFDASALTLEYIGPDGGERLTDLDLDELVDELRAIKEEFEERYPQGLPKAVGGEVDSRVVRPVHRHLSAFAGVDQLSRLGFWRWLSNLAYQGFFWSFIDWRFKERKQINWGITSPSKALEAYFYRAWLRGHLMYDETLPDPYGYAQKGASDVWRSHILRQEFGRDLNFRKAFLDYLVDSDGRTKVSSTKLRQKVIPALRAWTSGGTFSHLTYDECSDLIESLVEEGI